MERITDSSAWLESASSIGTGAGRGRATSSPDDAASLERLGRGNSEAVLAEIGSARATQLLWTR